MGLYGATCRVCGSPFIWWSGDRYQICVKCMDNMSDKDKAAIKLWENLHSPPAPIDYGKIFKDEED